ncbi:MAG: hypothetical protein JNL28_10915 [Planctomycetes bacterium]|nr:hypothetical protein [Planctomycetota bacterium]
MAQSSNPVCITCGLQTGDGTQLNRMQNGQICPTCRERVLDSIPSALPCQPWRTSVEPHFEAEAVRESHVDLQSRPWPPHGYGPSRPG